MATSSQSLAPAEEAEVLTNVKANAKSKACARPLDPERTMPYDPRDPRASPATWPCNGKHVEGNPQGNPHGAWATCEVCALRLWYQPRKGSPSNHTMVNNAAMVQKALTLLQPMLRGALPTEEIVKAMLDKITAEEKLNNKVQYLLEKPNVENSLKVPKSKAASKNVEKKMVVTMGYMDQSSPMTSPSDSSWDPILDSPDRRNLEDFLTEQEKIDLRNLVLARKGMTPPDEVILTEESQ